MTAERIEANFEHAELTRDEGVLTVRLHTEGGPMLWGAGPHEELPRLFQMIGADRDNQVVILTGTGDDFIGSINFGTAGRLSARTYSAMFREGRQLLTSLLDIDVPLIAAVNGPARVHAELAALCDIVIAADHAVFQDAPHFDRGLVPGDGVHVVWPMILGPNRGRYFLWTNQELSAAEALELGVVSEVVPAAELTARAEAIARYIASKPPRTIRYTRMTLVHRFRRAMAEELDLGIALEGLAAMEHWPSDA